MKKTLNVLLTGVIIIVLSILFLILYSNYLDSEITRLYKEKEDTLSLVSRNGLKDKGNAWIDETAENDALVILGSSELSIRTSQNIQYNFPNINYAGTTSCIGDSYVQNALHAMDLGANYDSLKDNDIVIIESIQWFFDDDIDHDGFMSNFSELQFYEFLNNDLISPKNKEYLCNRFLELENKRISLLTPDEISELSSENSILNGFGLTSKLAQDNFLKVENSGYDYLQTHILAKLYISDNFTGKTLYQIVRPYYFIRYRLMSLKDKYDTYVEFKNTLNDTVKSINEADWDNQLNQAQLDGEAACTNNDFYINNEYFNDKLVDEWPERKNKYSTTPVLLSKEWKDYEFLLNVCDDLNLEPYFINVSCNAFYYDYVGLNVDSRIAYYKKNSATAENHGYDVYNGLVELEYDPYTFADAMHLGWKGWLHVSEAITDHFNGIKFESSINETNPELVSSTDEINTFLESIKVSSSKITGDIKVFSTNSCNPNTNKITVPCLIPDTRYAYAFVDGAIYDLHREEAGNFYFYIADKKQINIGDEITLYFVTFNDDKYYAETSLYKINDILNFDSASKEIEIIDDTTREFLFESNEDENVFDSVKILIKNVETGDVLPAPILSANTVKKGSLVPYKHEGESGEYFINLRAKSNLDDETVYFRCKLTQGETYYCYFDVEEFQNNKVRTNYLFFGQ